MENYNETNKKFSEEAIINESVSETDAVEFSEPAKQDVSEEKASCPEKEKSSKVWMLKLIPSVLGIILGIAIIIMGLAADFDSVNFSSYDGTTGSTGVTDSYRKAYGGDAYTGIQNAASDAADNAALAALNVVATNYILENIDSSLTKFGNNIFEAISFIVTVVGVITTGVYAVKFVDVIVTEKVSSKRKKV